MQLHAPDAAGVRLREWSGSAAPR